MKRPCPSTSHNTVIPWKMPELMKNEVCAKEEEIAEHKKSVGARRYEMDQKEAQIHDKKKWIKCTKSEIKKAEEWINEYKQHVRSLEAYLNFKSRTMYRKIAWVEQEKKKFPLDYPEMQAQDEE